MGNKPIMVTISDTDAVMDVDAAPVGDPDADAGNHPLHSLQSDAGPKETAHTGATNAHTLPTDTKSMRPSCT